MVVFPGRGYLDNVKLASARPGEGTPAPWVQTCSCPPGYEGQFCERCSAGFTRSSLADGAFSRCQTCTCRGDSCDSDCYSADQTGGEASCPRGFYRDPLSRSCNRCPCPQGVSCFVEPGSVTPRCERCPSGTTGEHWWHEFVLSNFTIKSVGGANKELVQSPAFVLSISQHPQKE